MELANAIKRAKRVYLIGNGGSYANAMHIANDLIACGIKAYTLDPASLTASANDHGYETVFSRWISTVGEKGDLLIVLSGSGNSKNLVNAVKTARKKKIAIYAILGSQESKVGRLLKEEEIEGGGMNMQGAEEYQLEIGHNVMQQLKVIVEKMKKYKALDGDWDV